MIEPSHQTDRVLPIAACEGCFSPLEDGHPPRPASLQKRHRGDSRESVIGVDAGERLVFTYFKNVGNGIIRGTIRIKTLEITP